MNGYWKKRQHYQYYQSVLEFARSYAPKAQTLLDVGNGGCRYLDWFDWVPDKTLIDLEPIDYPGVRCIQGDFMRQMSDLRNHQPVKYDLVLCLQVLEHDPTPALFCARLRRLAHVLIVSVPYEWPTGHAGHRHDPMDELTLYSWMDRHPSESEIVQDGNRRRLVAVYR